MMETVEYRTLIRQTVDLRLAVKNHLINLGSRLMAENLISSYQDEQIRNPQLSASDRAANLVMFIQDKVHEDSQYYHTFMKVLAHNYLLYQPVYMKLQHTYAELQQEQPTLEVSACANSEVVEASHTSSACVVASTDTRPKVAQDQLSQDTTCAKCNKDFNFRNRKYRCPNCGKLVCHLCSKNKFRIFHPSSKSRSVCDECFNLLSPVHRVEGHASPSCKQCKSEFTFFKRKSHCSNCGYMVCHNCLRHKVSVYCQLSKPEGVCRICYDVLSKVHENEDSFLSDISEEADVGVQILENEISFQSGMDDLARFCVYWRLIGRELKLTEEDISEIDHTFDTEVEKRGVMLKKWSKKYAFRAKFRDLIASIHICGLRKQAVGACKIVFDIVLQDITAKAKLELKLLNSVATFQVLLEVAEFCIRWPLIATSLQLSHYSVSAIKSNTSMTESKKREEMLKKWKIDHREQATYRVLVKALLACEPQQHVLKACKVIASDIALNSIASEVKLSIEALTSEVMCQKVLLDLARIPWQLKLVGHHLNLTATEIDGIYGENGTENSMRLNMLRTWREKNVEKATYYVFVKALYNCEENHILMETCRTISLDTALHRVAAETKTCIQLLNCENSFLPDILCDLAQFCVQWKLVGKHLELTDIEVEEIDSEYHTEDEKRIKILSKWHKKHSHPTYRDVVVAILACEEERTAIEACKVISRKTLEIIASEANIRIELLISEVASKRVREQLTKFCCDWKLIENLSATTLTIIDSENIGDFEKKRNLLLELKNSKATFDELILAIFICGQLQPAIQACTVIFCAKCQGIYAETEPPLKDVVLDSKPSEKVLLDLARSCIQWKLIGKQLKLTSTELEQIDDDETLSSRKPLNMLAKWSVKSYLRPTYRTLIKALLLCEKPQHAKEACKIISTYANLQHIADEANICAGLLDLRISSEQVLECLAQFFAHWKSEARFLELSDADISTINGEYDNESEKRKVMLKTWNQTSLYRTKYCQLVIALLCCEQKKVAVKACEVIFDVILEEITTEAKINVRILSSEPLSRKILSKLADLCVHWKLVGKELNLTDNDISAVDSHCETENEKPLKMILKWKERFHQSYNRLIIAIYICEQKEAAIQACRLIIDMSVQHIATKAGVDLDKLMHPISSGMALLDLAEFCVQWKIIGKQLKLINDDITMIDTAESKTEAEKRTAMILKWKESCQSEATYKMLLEALLMCKTENGAHQMLDACKCISLEPIRELIGAFYEKQAEAMKKERWPPVKEVDFIQLALIKQPDGSQSCKFKTVYGQVDDIVGNKTFVSFRQVFDNIQKGSRLILEGRPGSGKTTLMIKVSNDWTKGLILRAKLVVFIQLRRLQGQTILSLNELLAISFHDLSTSEYFQPFCSHIERYNGAGIVFVLDGLDEYAPGTCKSNYIYKLIMKDELPLSSVIISSRPAATHSFRCIASVLIEVVGFLKEQVFQYIQNYYEGNKLKADELCSHLKQHPNVMNIAYLPLHCAMLVFLFDDNEVLPETETKFYKHFTLSTLQRAIRRRGPFNKQYYLSSFQQLDVKDKALFDKICKLAFDATVESKQVFSSSEIDILRKLGSTGSDQTSTGSDQTSTGSNQTSTGSDQTSLGLVVIDRYFMMYGVDESYTFLHLKFQEYLAAVYIYGLSKSVRDKIISELYLKDHLLVVWRFLCGMMKFTCTDARETFSMLMNACKDDLYKMHCCHESQQPIPCSYVMSGVGDHIRFDANILTPSDCAAISYAIKQGYSRSLLHLNLSGKKLEESQAQALEAGLKGFTAIQEFDLSNNNIGDAGALAIINSLNCCNNLRELNLINNGISNDGAIKVVKCLNRKHRFTCFNLSGSILDIQQESWTFVGIANFQLHLECNTMEFKAVIREFICTCSFLRELNVSGRRISDRVLLLMLQQESNIQVLNLSNCSINDAGAKILGEVLAHHRKMKMIILSKNYISNEGTQDIAAGLKHCSELSEINFAGNTIKDCGVQALAECLCHCKNLTTVNFCGNCIGDHGAQAFAECLYSCKNMETVNLSENAITSVGAKALVSGLKHCAHIKNINLWVNNLGEEGIHLLKDYIKHWIFIEEKSHTTGWIKLSQRILSLSECCALGHAISHSGYVMVEVTLDECHFNLEGAVALLRAIGDLRCTMKLIGCNYKVNQSLLLGLKECYGTISSPRLSIFYWGCNLNTTVEMNVVTRHKNY